jgi:hypothetical protein
METTPEVPMPDSTTQNFANHKRFDPLYHGSAILVLAALALAVVMAVRHHGLTSLWALLVTLVVMVLWLRVRVYALKVQDRVIRLEETLRLRALLPAALAGRIAELSPRQFVALRFASDAELEALFTQAVDERLGSTAIKQRIRNWRPDTFRV